MASHDHHHHHSPVNLQSLPVEVLRCIIRLVDPIGVVSLAQASTHLRAVVSPGRAELGERLLQWETLPAYGGHVCLPGPASGPKYGTRASVSPEDDLRGMRWACLGCMRLLPHARFDNHSLLKLKFRKPVPGTPAHDAPVTSWDLPRHPRRRAGKLDTCRAGRQHDSQGGDELEDVAWQLDRLSLRKSPQAKRRERQRWGAKRHLRRCNECRFQMGHIGRRRHPRTGTVVIPIQMSRRVQFDDVVERYFPGLADALGRPRPEPRAPSLLWMNPRQAGHNWTLCLLRCPACAQWREWRAFLFANDIVNAAGIDYPLNMPEALAQLSPGAACCDACAAQRDGRDALARRLATGLRSCLVQRAATAVQKLERGFFLIRLALSDGLPYWLMSRADRDELGAHLQGTFRGTQLHGRLEPARVVFLRERFAQATALFRRLLAEYGFHEELKAFSMWTELELWLRHYDDIEAVFYWATGLLDGDVLNPEVIVDWALARGGALV